MGVFKYSFWQNNGRFSRDYASLSSSYDHIGDEGKTHTVRSSRKRRGIKWFFFTTLSLLGVVVVLTLAQHLLFRLASTRTLHSDHAVASDPVKQSQSQPSRPEATVRVTKDSHSEASIHTTVPSQTASLSKPTSSRRPSKDPILGALADPFHLYYSCIPTNAGFQPVPNSYSAPPEDRPRTPLFIGFTRNNDMLVQTVLSYIAAGWPREDIIIVDNSGTMDANPEGLLSKDNPFYLDYADLRRRLGVSILQTPTLLNFAQLMNFYIRTSIARKWSVFFWSHMDIVVMSDEAASPFQSFYTNVLDVLNQTTSPSSNEGNQTDTPSWAVRFFNFDYLTLVNVDAWRRIGQWDTFIPYYASDCDAYSRMYLSGLESRDRTKVIAGRIYDIADLLPDLESKLFGESPSEGSKYELNSRRHQTLRWELEKLERFKQSDQSVHRNSWQGRNKGGKSDPWTYDAEGFEHAWWVTAGNGQRLFEQKWGSKICDLDESGWDLSRIWKPKEPEEAAP